MNDASELRLLRHYVYSGYGNATGTCAGGYPQQQGLICGFCGHDNSDGSPCPAPEYRLMRPPEAEPPPTDTPQER